MEGRKINKAGMKEARGERRKEREKKTNDRGSKNNSEDYGKKKR